MQFVLFTNYTLKQIVINGRRFEFTQVKVVKLGVEHYNCNMSCGNNNIRHDSDHACLPSRVLKMSGADLNSIILGEFLVIFIMIFYILLLLMLSLLS